ncbi:hypothetical protein FQA47_003091 [Oryzias melastigma]|uniref:Uncharacterized protein n=1 Tax=Oryzias melastigma TaxID=30732 RepID=A0A834CEN3_ORYME|nr:hypothetical protein FQA47_003091 [Oryzias melastigma]
MTADVFVSSKSRFHLEHDWMDESSRSFNFHSACPGRGVRRALQWSPAVLCCAVRAEGGTKEAEDNSSECGADRGSDSTFQMADIARRILVRGSTTPPVCETAHYFLLSCLTLSSVPLPLS